MSSYKKSKIQQALSKKGFIAQEGTKHDIFTLVVDGKTTSVHTFFSRGISEYGNSLLGAMKKQLHLESPKELDDLIRCPMSQEKLIELLNDRGVLENTSNK